MSTQAQHILDLNGRPLGNRALQKREQILDATRTLVEERSLRDVLVAHIARVVGTSPATFYQYFADVEDAVLHLAARANEQIPQLLALFEGTWKGREGRDRSREVVLFFMHYWDQHGPILRIRNLAADEGDMRFMALRAEAMRPILAAMVALMERSGGAARDPDINPASAALAMCSVLDRMAAYHRVMDIEGVNIDELVTTSARIVYRTLTGR